YLYTGGGEGLKAMAKTLTDSLRTVDSLGRGGGEEFLVVAPETHLEGVGVLAERIRVTVEKTPILHNNHSISVTVSIGFAVAEGKITTDYDKMKIVAAAALNEAKRTGRNRSIVHPV